MINFGALAKTGGAFVTRFAGRSALTLSKHAPTILTGVGAVGVVGTAVLASKATLHLESELKDVKSALADVREIKELQLKGELPNGVEYSKTQYAKDLLNCYSNAAFRLVKLYLPSILMGTLSISCMIGTHAIMKSRNAGLAMAYAGVEKAYRSYRGRVREEFGEEKDLEFALGGRTEKTTVVNDEGKKEEKEVLTMDLAEASPYAKAFGPGNPNWNPDPELTLFFLRRQQSHANDLLRIQGHLFLNEVYDLLGFPRTTAGAVTGWVKGNGDDVVDFGLYDISNFKKRDFINGYEDTVLLDFNVDGVIHELI